MKKMNNILKMISKMEKNAEEVKLAKHEVKLALVDDFNKEYENAIDLQTKAVFSITDYNELAKKIISILDESEKTFLKANSKYKEIEQMAKELGIEPNAQLKTKKENISVFIKELYSYVRQLNEVKI
jgi:hypothetical protein